LFLISPSTFARWLALTLIIFTKFSQAYQWSRPIPTSLKVIHSRVYAQAITLGALGAVAAIELYAQSKGLGSNEEEEQ
jgi:Hypoxia induced protein conserved region